MCGLRTKRLFMERGIKKACKHNFKFPERQSLRIGCLYWSMFVKKIVLLSIYKGILSAILFSGLTRVSVLLPLHSTLWLNLTTLCFNHVYLTVLSARVGASWGQRLIISYLRVLKVLPRAWEWSKRVPSCNKLQWQSSLCRDWTVSLKERG